MHTSNIKVETKPAGGRLGTSLQGKLVCLLLHIIQKWQQKCLTMSKYSYICIRMCMRSMADLKQHTQGYMKPTGCQWALRSCTSAKCVQTMSSTFRRNKSE